MVNTKYKITIFAPAYTHKVTKALKNLIETAAAFGYEVEAEFELRMDMLAGAKVTPDNGALHKLAWMAIYMAIPQKHIPRY